MARRPQTHARRGFLERVLEGKRGFLYFYCSMNEIWGWTRDPCGRFIVAGPGFMETNFLEVTDHQFCDAWGGRLRISITVVYRLRYVGRQCDRVRFGGSMT